MSFVVELVLVLLASASIFFLYIKWNRQYWKRKNVPTIETNSLWGNIENPFTSKLGLNLNMKKMYDEFRRLGHMHGGINLFTEAAYMPVDTELIKHILAKDFSHFIGHGFPINKEKEPLTAHLFNLDGEEWRNMRVQLTPTFTSGKMKMMFNTLLDCGGPMIQHVDKLCKDGEPLNIKEILACYTTDIIGSCAFGLECNSFEDPNAEFRKHGRKIFTPSLYFAFLQFISFIMPSITKWFYFRRMEKETETFFISAVQNIIDYRKSNNLKRNDFIQLLLEINDKAKVNGGGTLTLNEMAAQSFVFFLAGFETSSTTMTFSLHELAFNQGIQDKLREEIRETMKRFDGKLTYEGIMEMKYMDKVIDETLRKYPPVPIVNRVCNKTYKVPNTNVIIEEGTKVFISVLGIHKDEKYYPDSNKFDPERFSEESKAKRPTFTFLPFGEGPRMCIGLRFGVMQAKTGLAMLLNNFRILPAKGETYDIQFDPKSFIMTKKGHVMLNAINLNA